MKCPSPVIQAMLAVLVVTGCSSYRPTPAAFHEILDQPYRLDAGDRLRVTVYEQDALTNTYSVDQSAKASFPLVGAVPARSYTTQQIEATIAAKLRDGFLRDPDVSAESRSLPSDLRDGRSRRGRASTPMFPASPCRKRLRLPAASRIAPTKPTSTSPATSTAR